MMTRGRAKFKLRNRSFKMRHCQLFASIACVIAILQVASSSGGQSARHTRRPAPATDDATRNSGPEVGDPMEPCYLANNRASETLTISESTPMGTIVGELMVNGDSSRDGNIELSIKMPGASGHQTTTTTGATRSLLSTPSKHSTIGATQRHKQTDDLNSSSTTADNSTRRIAGQSLASEQTGTTSKLTTSQVAKNARDLSQLIDLMPPLSIDPESKKLILAKKLDRENLDKYIQAGSYQSSYTSINSLSQVSSASLTVHIKCQLRLHRRQTQTSESGKVGNELLVNNSLNLTTTVATSGGETFKSAHLGRQSQATNSILIPIHLIVTDENDNWPNFIGSPYIIDLNESAPIGSLLQGNEIVAVDNDQQGPLSTIEYAIVAGSLWSDAFAFLNPLDARSLIVKDNRLLDYESQSKLTLRVMARDQGDPPNWAITSLYVNLLDQDDLNPVFSEDKFAGLVRDNRPGEVIDLMPRRLMATDGDKTLNAPISYSLHTKSEHFELDSDLGHLTLRKALPDFAPPTTCLLARATQVDNPQRFTLTAINLRLAKFDHLLTGANYSSGSFYNQQVARFAQPSYTVEISESAQIGSTVITLRAGQAAGINYQLLDNELAYLAVDKHSGRVTVSKQLDFEMYRRLTVRILATLDDNDEQTDYPKLSCDITRLNVEIKNQNEFTPEFSHEQYNFQLSVSDLIANFESPTNNNNNNNDETDSTDSSTSAQLMFGRRFGDMELGGDETALNDELDYRALQLGQVYCADRDRGDKVTLALNGSKANLFKLTQDGRLFLPLVNVSHYLDAQSSSSERVGGDQRQDAGAHLKHSQRTINNKFFQQMTRRVYGSSSSSSSLRRRADENLDSLDRNYLNYLLSEFSNLGRLRLKVVAIDDGQPEQRHSTALVIITIFSIDNFIIQRPHSPPTAPSPVHLNTSTSYQTASEDRKSSQVMMIPSANGRSFVHINPDIISNLLSNKPTTNSSFNNQQKSTSDPESLDSAASNLAVSHIAAAAAAATPVHRTIQPPGLLVVDEEGAKFVAMPAAIEVYKQQVEEADQQTQRQRSRGGATGSPSSRRSFWHSSWWADKFGWTAGDEQPASSTSGLVHWINLSTAILLHLIVLALLLTLVFKFKSTLNSSSAGSGNSQDSSEGALWPRRFSAHLSSFFASDKSLASRHDHTISSILNQGHIPTYGQATSTPSSSSQMESILAQHRSGSYESSSSSRFAIDNPTRQHAIVSSGLIVSAKANATKREISTDNQRNPNLQQNLFDHLKLRLNKMIDHKADERTTTTTTTTRASPTTIDCDMANQIVSVRPLDSDVVAFEDMRDRQLEACAQYRETAELQVHQKCAPVEEKSVAISTFVGASAQRSFAAESKSAAVVSINIKAKPINSNNNNASSSSSVISLVSSSSSLSNKISEALAGRASGSDASSLNSSILLNAAGRHLSSSSSSQSSGAPARKKAPPAPPPLPPPPPSRIQVGGQKLSSVRNAARQQPENPVHARLRRQAMSEQQANNASDRRQRSSAKAPPLPVGGRREARLVTTTSSPPTPPPMPTTGGGALKSTTTVSPTTSVDRGYESFQSYTSGKQASNNNICKQQRQFHSLPECASSSSAALSPRVNHAASRRAKTATFLYPQQVDNCTTTTTTTEDEDFYYCCAEPHVHSSEVHELSVGGLLTDYASHTYKQPAVARASRVRSHNQRPDDNLDLMNYCEQSLNQKCDTTTTAVSQQQQQRAQSHSTTASRQRRAAPVSSSQSSQQRRPAAYYQQQQQRVNVPLNKKQLTWSDQVLE